MHSSIHRHQRAHAMNAPLNETDLFKFAYDTEDKAYPIYREKNLEKPGICCVSTGNLRFIYTYNYFKSNFIY